MNYYNENDPKAVAWLKELIKNGLIPNGEVDSRSIEVVQPLDLKGFTQCHFFAGIGGWSYALQLAGWPKDVPVWTGSCPCQPFSVAGKALTNADHRDLWPHFRRLIYAWRPSIIFGEQVAESDGRTWVAGIRTELEMVDYAVGAADLCAACVGSPQNRPRLYWVAHSTNLRRQNSHQLEEAQRRRICQSSRSSQTCNVWRDFFPAKCDDGKTRRIEPGTIPLVNGIPQNMALLRGYGNAIIPQVAAEFITAYVKVLEDNENKKTNS